MFAMPADRCGPPEKTSLPSNLPPGSTYLITRPRPVISALVSAHGTARPVGKAGGIITLVFNGRVPRTLTNFPYHRRCGAACLVISSVARMRFPSQASTHAPVSAGSTVHGVSESLPTVEQAAHQRPCLLSEPGARVVSEAANRPRSAWGCCPLQVVVPGLAIRGHLALHWSVGQGQKKNTECVVNRCRSGERRADARGSCSAMHEDSVWRLPSSLPAPDDHATGVARCEHEAGVEKCNNEYI